MKGGNWNCSDQPDISHHMQLDDVSMSEASQSPCFTQDKAARCLSTSQGPAGACTHLVPLGVNLSAGMLV